MASKCPERYSSPPEPNRDSVTPPIWLDAAGDLIALWD